MISREDVPRPEDQPDVRRCRSSGSSSPQKAVEEFLFARNEDQAKTNPMPEAVLAAVVGQYAKISAVLSGGFGKSGTKKEVVRRGNRRKEVIAALLHFELIRAGIAKKRDAIAKFVGLPTAGFSRGESILRQLNAAGHYELPPREGRELAYVRKYFAALGIDDDNLTNFVVALVEATDRMHACADSRLASKVVGAIWVAVCKQGLAVTAKDIEAVDSIKKSTFTRYSRYVEENIEKYADVFAAYSIERHQG